MDFVQLAPFHYRRVPTQMATDMGKNHWIFRTSLPRFAWKSDLTALRAPRWCPKCPVSWLLVTPSAPSDGRNTLWCLAGSTGLQVDHPGISWDDLKLTCSLTNLPSGEHTKSYWKWWFIVDFPIKNGGSFHCYVSSPEGNLWKLWNWGEAGPLCIFLLSFWLSLGSMKVYGWSCAGETSALFVRFFLF